MAFRDVILADSPDLFWELEETSGTNAADSGSGGHAGTHQSGATVNQTGPINRKAVDYNDTANGRTTSSYSPFVTNGQITVEGVAWRDTSTAADTLWGSNGAVSTMLRVVAASTSMTFWSNSGSTSYTWTSAWPGNTQWAHYAFTFDDSTNVAELWINGTSLGTNTVAPNYSSPGTFVLAARGGGSEPWDGKHDYVAVWLSILSGAQIAAHYNASIAIPTLVASRNPARGLVMR